MSDYDDILDNLKQKRDELRLQMHLASREARDEWEVLEAKMKRFSEKAELNRSGEAVGDALKSLGSEIKEGYERIRKAMKS